MAFVWLYDLLSTHWEQENYSTSEYLQKLRLAHNASCGVERLNLIELSRWGRASQLCSRWWPLRLETRQERTRGGVNLGCAGGDLDGCGWGLGPSCALGGRHCG